MSAQNKRFMQTALRLAKRGIGSVEPNPAVGAVVVKDSQIIGKGYHKKFGGPHAEINALEDCVRSGAEPHGATMYVTLEPCCHQGKTGPCTQTIISAGLAKVVVAMIDPSKHASGKGIEQLRQAGIEVQTGLCETEARLLNAPFVKYASTGKCWITLKWAQSIDGKLAWTGHGERRWISNELSQKDVHKLRRRAQAILVGINTVLADDPLLTARPSKGKKATRIVLDNDLRIPPDCQLLRTAKKSPVMIVTRQHTVEANPRAAEQVRKKGAELLVCPETPDRSHLAFLLDELS
ncbi:MAG: bifunctional diaminohydroxyphosphoribosylaminopyrimidine deaminase/5-amino-6-(5-phosphoribosylamino)uracil reductase RibD, partial [Sedimentisphaerales bacterium]|nr:bifunctional diaminohydroxyphosphoribosylaminopyrimidine deaminase/5-amino-6-(5-phosphoribosylamino)uracil reductase RibD [Sedimentisphaerales bacterium]